MKHSFMLYVLFLCTFSVVCNAKPIYKDWDEYSKAIRSAQGDLRTTESAHRAIRLCEAVIASPEDTAEIRIASKLKIASVIVPGPYNFRIVPGLTDLPRALKLTDEVMNESKDNGDRYMCLSLRARALAWQGKAPEAEAALAQLEKMATASPNAEAELWGWAIVRNDLFTRQGKTDEERIAWYLERAKKEPQTKLGQNCAAYVGVKAVSPKVKEADVETALVILRKYHSGSENTRLVENSWRLIQQDRQRRARANMIQARAAARRAPAVPSTGDPKVDEVKRILARDYPGTPVPGDATLRKMLAQVKVTPRILASALGSYWENQNRYPTEVQALTSPIAYLSPQSLTLAFPK